MGKRFSPERLANNRRMRKARRLCRKQPLFAYELMKQELPEYSYELFLDDLRYRTKPKKRKGKSGLHRYGRFQRMEKMIALFRETGEISYGLQAQQLRRNMTRPYRVRFTIKGEILEYWLDATIRIELIEQLVESLSVCDSMDRAEQKFREFLANSHIH